ncbi:MAG: T9SS type A sorting domain-containing protein [Ignavibacteriales bacterium]|nr:T9SS type A sorting domain-containing protein [Ignavibacteriales bacterium]
MMWLRSCVVYLLIVIFLVLTINKSFAQNFDYSKSVEKKNPLKVQTSNANIKLNYLEQPKKLTVAGLKSISSVSANSLADILLLNPTIYNRLTGSNSPEKISTATKFSARVCSDEYEPFSLYLLAKSDLHNIKVQWTDLTGAGGTIPSNALEAFIAKSWYQKGYEINGRGSKWLTQELLIKNDDLIKVDESLQTNSLLVQRPDGSKTYIIISDRTSAIPSTAKIFDSKDLLPFSLNTNRSKQLWFTLHTPDNAIAGFYSGTVTLTSDEGELSIIPIEIEVLPFKLDPSRLTNAIYYHGYVDDNYWKRDPFTAFVKSSKQYSIEMKDLKEHGILYPTTNQSYYRIGIDLNIRNQVGLPNDKLYLKTFSSGTPSAILDLINLKNKVISWKNRIAQSGYSNLYIYGIDEAVGNRLLLERLGWQAIHEAGAKVFAAGYYTNFNAVGDLLDVANIQMEPMKTQADLYHSVNHQIFNYSNPQVGIENPEIYRRNYGLLLWKANYDGSMNYAYQRDFGSIWNDFDVELNQSSPYRDHCFTYPITEGVISTVQWEGMREAVDDVRYLSTLLNRMDSLKSLGNDISSYKQFVESIDPSKDLDNIRANIIDQILKIEKGGISGVDPTPPQLVKAMLYSATSLKITFSEPVLSDASVASNYSISNNVIVTDASLSADQKQVTLTTSPHLLFNNYAITVINIKDLDGNLIASSANKLSYTYSDKVLRFAEEGILTDSSQLTTIPGSFGTNVVTCNTLGTTITFTIDFPKTADWYAWGRFYFGGGKEEQNSFLINVDDDSTFVFGSDRRYYKTWQWGSDGIRRSGPSKKLLLGNYSAGLHKITITGNEDSNILMLDMLLLTPDSSFVPSDENIVLLKDNNHVTENNIDLPESFELFQNYPNPFNPSTRIKFGLPKNSFVSLKIFDILGREVTTLVNKDMDAGYYEMELNSNAIGGLASGIYIYSLITKDFTQSRKMILLK